MDSWNAFEGELIEKLRGLSDMEVVIIHGPSRYSDARTGLLKRKEVGQVDLYAQALRMDNMLHIEIVGGPHTGELFPWTDEEDAELRRMGWDHIRDSRQSDNYFARFHNQGGSSEELEGPALKKAAEMIIRSLTQVGGVSTPDDLRIEQQ